LFDESQHTFGSFEDRAVWLIEKLLPDFSPTWNSLDAYAVAGNLGEESGIQMIQEVGQTPPHGGFGLPQWTGPRRTQFTTYCANTGRSPTAMRSGYDFLFVELKGTYAKVVSLVAAAPTLSDKVAAFEKHYEMAGVTRMADRLQYALRAQKAWENAHRAVQPPPPPPVQPPPAPKPPPAPPPVVTPPAPPKGSTMFNIQTLIGLISQAPTIIEGVMKLVTEVEAGYAKGKADGGDPIVIFEDILAALVANKGAVAKAVLGPEPVVTDAGAIVTPPKK
jgi:hypothetical protein